ERAVNHFNRLLPGSPRMRVDALTFIPEFGGFNTQSLKPSGKSYGLDNRSSIQYWKEGIDPYYSWYRDDVQKNYPRWNPYEKDLFLQYHFENYKNPKGWNNPGGRYLMWKP